MKGKNILFALVFMLVTLSASAQGDCPSPDPNRTIHTYNITHESCTGANDGVIDVTFNDGNPPFEFFVLWDVDANMGVQLISIPGGSVTFINVPPGNYSIFVSDAETLCTADVGVDADGNGIVVNPGNPIPNIYNITNSSIEAICDFTDLIVSLDDSDSSTVYEILVNDVGTGVTATGDGNPLDITVPSTEFTDGDVITVEAANGTCKELMNGDVTIDIQPTPTDKTILEAGNQQICEGESQSVTLQNSENNVDYEIYLDGTATGIIKPGPGGQFLIGNVSGLTVSGSPYIITVEATLGSCSIFLTDTINVTVNPRPVPTITGADTVCTGNSEIFTTESGQSNYDWTVTGTFSIISGGDGNDFVEVEWTASGDETVSVTYTDTNGCSPISPTDFNVRVGDVPTPTITGSIDTCEGSTEVYKTEPEKFNYAWNVSAGGTITSGGGVNDSTVTVEWNGTGAQSVSVNYEEEEGCTAPTPTVLNVTVNPAPVPTISGNTIVCVADTVTYKTESGMTNYDWTVSGGATIISGGDSNADSVTVRWDTDGSYQVSVNYEDANGCTALTPTVVDITVNPRPIPTITGESAVCEGDVEVYITESGQTNYNWSITSGGTVTNGGGSTDDFVEVTWNTAGEDTVRVNYTDTNGCTALIPAEFAVEITSIPTPTITGSTDTCEAAIEIYKTEPEKFNYSWAVSAGGTITSGGGTSDSTITVKWDGTGAQTVSVNYEEAAGCTAPTPTVLNVTVNPAPVPTISGNTIVCVADTVTYKTESGMTNYDWAVSGGATILSGGDSNADSVTVRWDTDGSYQISVNYEDANGCIALTPTVIDITVNPMPVPTITGESNICEGDVEVYTTESGQTNYTWNVTAGGTVTGGGGSTDDFVEVTWNTTGQDTVRVNYTDANGCTALSPTELAVQTSAFPAPSIAGPADVCEFEANVIYSTTDNAGNAYDWIVTGGTITSGQGTNSITVDWGSADTGSVKVTETVNPANCSTSDSISVVIHQIPDPLINGPSDVCENETNTVFSTVFNSGNSYNWTITGGSVVSTDTSSVVVDWGSAGSGSVKVIQTVDSTGCQDSAMIAVTIHAFPSPVVSGPSDICKSDTVTFSTSDSGNKFEWTVDGGNIVGSDSTFSISVVWQADSGSVKVKETNPFADCSTISDTLIITGYDIPSPSISGLTSVCNNDTGVSYSTTNVSGNNYTWTVIGGTIASGQGTSSITVDWGTADTGTVTVVEEVAAAGCSVQDQLIVIIGSTTENPPIVTSELFICQGSALPTLVAEGTNIKWYTDASLTNLVDSDSAYTPSASELDVNTLDTTTFYVTQDEGCGESPAAEVDVIVVETSPPPNPENADVRVCKDSSVPTLTVEGTDVTWYGDQNLNNFLASGESYTPTNELDISTVGTTSFYATQNIGCDESEPAEITVTVETTLQKPALVSDRVGACLEDDPPRLVVIGGNNNIWYSDADLTDKVGEGEFFIPDSTMIDMSVVGNTVFYVADSNSCGIGDVSNVTISVRDCNIECVTLDSLLVDNADCNDQNGSINLSASTGPEPYRYIIDNGQNEISQSDSVFTNLSSGTYFITVEDANKCFVRDTVQLALGSTEVTASASDFEDASCFNGDGGSAVISILSGGSDPYEYSLDRQNWIEFSNGDTISNLPPNGQYPIFIRDESSDNCPDTVIVEINQPASAVIAELGESTESFTDEATGSVEIINIEGGTPTYEVRAILVDPIFGGQEIDTDWIPVTDSSSQGYSIIIDELFAGSYDIIVRDANGCEFILQANISFDDRLVIPNIFTPNGDGFNDVFFIRNLPEDPVPLVVTNRWGKEVFRSNDYKNEWDGTDLDEGVYFYSLNIGGRNITGWVELLRGGN